MLPRKGRGTEPTQNSKTVEPQKQNKSLTKRPRLSRDERRFDKDTEKSLTVSMETVSNTLTTPCEEHSSVCQETPHPPNSDLDYQPPKQDEEECEEEEKSLSESDSDFSDAAPPQKKKTTRPTKTAKTVRGGNNAGATNRKMETIVERAHVGKKQETNHSTIAHRTKSEKSASDVHTPSTSITNTPKSNVTKSSLVSSPGQLGMRRMPNWTPPGETYTYTVCCVYM